jgi:hypothetical protein
VLVDLATMARAKNKNQEFAVIDFIDDAVVACSNSPFAFATN